MSQESEVGKPQHTPNSKDQGRSAGALFSSIHSADLYWIVTMCHILVTLPGQIDLSLPSWCSMRGHH